MTLKVLGVARRTYYRWVREQAWTREPGAEPPRPVQPYETLPEEKAAVVAYALRHPGLRHRELRQGTGNKGTFYFSES
jgi:hypothetical protein